MIFAAASLLVPVLILFELQPEKQSQVRKQKQVSGSNHILVHVGRNGFLFDLYKGKEIRGFYGYGCILCCACRVLGQYFAGNDGLE